MKTMLRNLAANWADTRFSKANDVLRHKLIRAEAAEQRLKQEKARLSNALRSYGQLVEACRQMREQAEHERDVALARQTELEEALVAVHTQRDAAAGLSSAWDGVVAAGLDGRTP